VTCSSYFFLLHNPWFLHLPPPFFRSFRPFPYLVFASQCNFVCLTTPSPPTLGCPCQPSNLVSSLVSCLVGCRFSISSPGISYLISPHVLLLLAIHFLAVPQILTLVSGIPPAVTPSGKKLPPPHVPIPLFDHARFPVLALPCFFSGARQSLFGRDALLQRVPSPGAFQRFKFGPTRPALLLLYPVPPAYCL